MDSLFLVIGGYLNIFGGIALLIYWYAFAIFLPYGELSTTLSILVKNRNWSWINWLGVSGATAGLLGQASIYLFQVEASNLFGSIGFYVAVLGTTFLIGTMTWETVLWPILVKQDESWLSFTGPIYSSRIFMPFFIVSGLVYAVGYVLVGIGVMQSGLFPALPGLLLAIGAPAFALGALFGKFQVYPRSLGVTLMSIGLIWFGLLLIN